METGKNQPVVARTVVVAGASGFIGRALIVRLLQQGHRVIALSRKARASDDPRIEWRACDLFSLESARGAVRGADAAVYLVHSMLPSSKLTQGAFQDIDLIAADNFARAAREAGASRIIYVGGLLPDGVRSSADAQDLSAHLLSRLEVEEVLSASGVACTHLRAGLIVGDGGSSTEILLRLVDRLPALVCPSWAFTPTSPVDLETVVGICVKVIEAGAEAPHGSFDLSGPDTLTYQGMMRVTAKVLGLRRLFFSLPWITTTISRLWLRAITGAPRDLVNPLIESMRTPMVPHEARIHDWSGVRGRTFEETLARIPRTRSFRFANNAPSLKEEKVRSVQRLHAPSNWTADRIAREYFEWLPSGVSFAVRVIEEMLENGTLRARFQLRFLPMDLLILDMSPRSSDQDLAVLRIVGGALARTHTLQGWLEFRRVLEGKVTLAAIHEFHPSLPWFLYRMTQAPIHAWVMKRFGKHLVRLRSGR